VPAVADEYVAAGATTVNVSGLDAGVGDTNVARMVSV
jgi:hypothetical protein